MKNRRLALLAVLLGTVVLVGWRLSPMQSQEPIAKNRPLPYGTIGDGIADDTSALQSVLSSSVGNISLPKGIYRITKPLVVDLDQTGFVSIEGHGTARIQMDGPGPAIRFVGTHGGTADPGTVKPNVWKNQRAPMVEGLEIVGTHPEAGGIEAEGTMQITLSRLVIRHTHHAIRLFKRNRNMLISDSHLYENRGAGIFLDDCDLHQINVTGSHISYNEEGGIVSLKGNVRNLQITGCDIEANMSSKGKPTANVLIDGTDSEFGTAEVAITGCTVQHTGKAPGCANVRILGRTKPVKDMPIVRQGHVTITGNVFSDVRTNIHLNGCRGVVISGNTFWEGFDHNLLVEDSVSVVVGPNSMDRNPHYERFGTAKEAKNDIVFQKCLDCTISGLHLTQVRGTEASITLDSCQRFHISGCSILDGEGDGIWLKDTTDSLISDCLIRNDRPEALKKVAVRETGGRGNQVNLGYEKK